MSHPTATAREKYVRELRVRWSASYNTKAGVCIFCTFLAMGALCYTATLHAIDFWPARDWTRYYGVEFFVLMHLALFAIPTQGSLRVFGLAACALCIVGHILAVCAGTFVACAQRGPTACDWVAHDVPVFAVMCMAGLTMGSCIWLQRDVRQKQLILVQLTQ